MKQSKGLSPLIIIGFIVVLAAVVFLGWKLSEPAKLPDVAAAPTPAVKPAAQKTVASAPPTSPGKPPAVVGPTPPPAPMVQTTPKTPEEAALEAADYKIGTIIAQEQTAESTRDKLLLLFPNFTGPEKIMAAPHIVNLTGDEDLPRMLPFLKNPLTPPEAMETFFNDMLNRPPELGWPVLVDLIGLQRHPMAERAKEILSTIVGEDHGNDPVKWRAGLKEQLESQGLELPASTPGTATPTAQ